MRRIATLDDPEERGRPSAHALAQHSLQLIGELTAHSLVSQHGLQLLAKLRNVAERPLESDQRLAQLEQLAQFGNLPGDSVRAEVIDGMKLEIDIQGGVGTVSQ